MKRQEMGAYFFSVKAEFIGQKEQHRRRHEHGLPHTSASPQRPISSQLTPHVVANRLIDNANNSHRRTPFSSRYGMITANGFTGTATLPTARMTSGTVPVSEAVSESTSLDFSCGRVSRIAKSA